MPIPFDLQRQRSRFQRLPQSNDVWEGAVVAMPTWVAGARGGDPYRPEAAVWVSTTRGRVHLGQLEPGGGLRPVDAALTAMFEMGMSSKLAGVRPRALRVRDAELAAALREALTDTGVVVEVADELPALRDFLSETAAALSQDGVPAALSAPGVTPDRLRAFADAGKAFFEAAPWRHLNDGDLIKIEAPRTGRGLDLLAVMGSAGQQFGLGFFSSVKQYRQVLARRPFDEILEHGGEWAVYFSPAWELPAMDLDTWERFGLPLAGPRAYPCAMRLDKGREPQRPDAGRLAHLEGVLRALAAATEAEMDSGRWSRTVATVEGERTYTLALPDLLDPSASPPIPDHRAMERMSAEIGRALQSRDFANMEEVNAFLSKEFTGRRVDDVESTAASPVERAQDLIYQAFETRGRRQLHLIRQALALWPDCADAYLLLSERTSSPDEVRSLLEQAVAAGERALGPGAFSDPDRSFGADVATRPYMRARTALADWLSDAREFDAAIDHHRALLRLDPEDRHGLRYRLMTVLLAANRNADAEALLSQYDEPVAQWQYAAVLLALRAGDRKLARRRLRSAIKANRRVPAYLTGRRKIPDLPPEYPLPGSDDEALICAIDLIEPWESTPGAVAWLRSETRDAR